MKFIKLFILLIVLALSQQSTNKNNLYGSPGSTPEMGKISLVVLGTVQDAGAPHIGCTEDCCRGLYQDPAQKRNVVSLGLIDPENQGKYIFEATPDVTVQLEKLKKFAPFDGERLTDAIFLTHAHIGHYTGLMYLGKEAVNADQIPVYVMPRMKSFLEQNGPWNLLISNNNITLREMQDHQTIPLTSKIKVVPFTVPHRDEFSETAGFIITGPDKSALFIPDIDKWDRWETDITEVISRVDYAFIDGTFYDGDELNRRDMSEIPHPFIIESMGLFDSLPAKEKNKIYFIHMNHTNPVLSRESSESETVIEKGFNIARINEVFSL